MKKCMICHKNFAPRSNNMKVCDECKTLKCEVCGKTYFSKRIRDVWQEHKYCSWDCACKGRIQTRKNERPYFNKRGPRKIRNCKPWFSKSHFYDGYRLCWDAGLCIYTDKAKKPIYIYLWEKYHGPIPKGYVIHHKDGNHHNNCLYNLELLTRAEHIRKHNINRWGRPDPVKMKGDEQYSDSI